LALKTYLYDTQQFLSAIDSFRKSMKNAKNWTFHITTLRTPAKAKQKNIKVKTPDYPATLVILNLG